MDPADPPGGNPATATSASRGRSCGCLAAVVFFAILSAPFLFAWGMTGEGCGAECRRANLIAMLGFEAVILVGAILAGFGVRGLVMRRMGAGQAPNRLWTILALVAAGLALLWLVAGNLFSMVY